MSVRKTPKTLVQSLLTAPTMLAVGLDPKAGKAYLLVKHADGATLKKEIPLSKEFEAVFMMARGLLS